MIQNSRIIFIVTIAVFLGISGLFSLVSAGGAGALVADSYEGSGNIKDATFLAPPTKTPTPTPTVSAGLNVSAGNTSVNATSNSTSALNATPLNGTASSGSTLKGSSGTSGEISLADQIKAQNAKTAQQIKNSQNGGNAASASNTTTTLMDSSTSQTGWVASFGAANPTAPSTCTT